MSKSKIAKKHDSVMLEELEDDFDFQDFYQPDENDEAIAGFMHGIIEASSNQMNLAVELTKLVVNKNTHNMNEEEIFLVFKKASDVIANSTPMKGLMEHLKAFS